MKSQNTNVVNAKIVPHEDWEHQLAVLVETMREMSRQTDPQAMVKAYVKRLKELMTIDRRLSLSRRGLDYPHFRITRSTTWTQDINPWKERHRLPVLSGGVLAEMLYEGEPRVIDELSVPEDDPAYEYLADQRSLFAIPTYDQGEALNMVILMRQEASAFSRDQVPSVFWHSNLFGRATTHLVLREELRQAYAELDRELKTVATMQRSLLPRELPKISTLDLAAYYQPAQRAGGDYYDFFRLPDDKWGILIADVSGHGTPAAVVMAVTHCIAHMFPGPAIGAGKVLEHLNHHLATRYAAGSGTFVTAFYGVYDSVARTLTYASAGHNPPRLKRCRDGSLLSLNQVNGLPLGVLEDATFDEVEQELQPGDQIVFYTDGITEAQNAAGELFGTHRLDSELENCSLQARSLLDSVLAAVESFSGDRPPDDDRTMVVARVN